MIDIEVQLGSRAITPASRPYVIAEIGVNHNGKIDLAKKLIKIAKNSGADAVKFQSYISKDLVSKKAKLASYQKKKVKHN